MALRGQGIDPAVDRAESDLGPSRVIASIARAALLSEPGHNILEVALSVGFESLSHLNATFRDGSRPEWVRQARCRKADVSKCSHRVASASRGCERCTDITSAATTIRTRETRMLPRLIGMLSAPVRPSHPDTRGDG